MLNLPDFEEPFGFFFDRGCYHAVRREAPHKYATAVARLLTPGARGLVLAGNAREPHDPGPPVVTKDKFEASSAGPSKSSTSTNSASTKPPASRSAFWAGAVCCKSAEAFPSERFTEAYSLPPIACSLFTPHSGKDAQNSLKALKNPPPEF